MDNKWIQMDLMRDRNQLNNQMINLKQQQTTNKQTNTNTVYKMLVCFYYMRI